MGLRNAMPADRGTRALVFVALAACCAAIVFLGAVESAQEQGATELAWQTPWLSKHANDESYYYWSDATARKGEVVVECWGGLETKSKDSSDCASVHKKFFGKRFKRVPKAKGPGGSLPVKTLTSE